MDANTFDKTITIIKNQYIKVVFYGLNNKLCEYVIHNNYNDEMTIRVENFENYITVTIKCLKSDEIKTHTKRIRGIVKSFDIWINPKQNRLYFNGLRKK